MGVVGIFVAGHDLIEALPQQGLRVVMNAIVLSRVAEPGGPIAGKLMALIERAQRQQTGIAGDLATGEVSQNRLMTVEGEAELWQNTLYQAMDAPKGNAGWRNPVFINFLEHPLFFG